MARTHPYIIFNGNCLEAIEFYKECLGGELSIMTLGQTPIAAHYPDMRNRILHSILTNNGILIVAVDIVGSGDIIIKGNNMAISVTCESEDEIRNLFLKLSNGGVVTNDLKKTDWGAMYCELEDKFGIRWFLNLYKEQQNFKWEQWN